MRSGLSSSGCEFWALPFSIIIAFPLRVFGLGMGAGWVVRLRLAGKVPTLLSRDFPGGPDFFDTLPDAIADGRLGPSLVRVNQIFGEARAALRRSTT